MGDSMRHHTPARRTAPTARGQTTPTGVAAPTAGPGRHAAFYPCGDFDPGRATLAHGGADPALNEEDALPAVLRALPIGRLQCLVVADNGSTDNLHTPARLGMSLRVGAKMFFTLARERLGSG